MGPGTIIKMLEAGGRTRRRQLAGLVLAGVLCGAGAFVSPPAAATPGKKSAGLVFDDIEDTPWAIEGFSRGTSW